MDSDAVENALSQQGHFYCLRRYQRARQEVGGALRDGRMPASWAQRTIAYFRQDHATAVADRAEWSLAVLG